MNEKYYVSIILLSLFLIGASAGFQARLHQPSLPIYRGVSGIDDFALYLHNSNVQSVRELYNRYAVSAIQNATRQLSPMMQFNMPTAYDTNTGSDPPPVVLSSSLPFLIPLATQIKKRKDWVLFLATALVVLFAGWSVGSSYGSITGPVTQANPSQESYRFIISADGSTITARNGLTGEVDYSATDAATVIQWAANSLSHSRHSIETILIHGSFTIAKSTTLTSYTKIILNGSLTIGHSVSQPIFKVTSTPATRIYFSGGTYDMNSTANPEPSNAIDFQDANTTYVIAHDVTFQNIPRSSFGIHFAAPNNNNIIINHNWCYRCGGSAGFSSGGLVLADFGSQIVVTNNYSNDGGIDIRLATATYSVVAANKIEGNYPNTGGGGVTLVGKGGHDVVVSQNEISGKAQECVEIVQLSRVYVVNNELFQCANEGLHLWGIAHSLIGNNLLWDNGVHSPDNSQITTQVTLGLYGDSAVHNWFLNNVIYADGATTLPQYAIWENSTSDFNLFYGNIIRGYSIAAYHLQGPHDIVEPSNSSQVNQFPQAPLGVTSYFDGYPGVSQNLSTTYLQASAAIAQRRMVAIIRPCTFCKTHAAAS